jgi:hypothetical protein
MSNADGAAMQNELAVRLCRRSIFPLALNPNHCFIIVTRRKGMACCRICGGVFSFEQMNRATGGR